MPSRLDGIVVQVLGLDTRPVVQPQMGNPITNSVNPQTSASAYGFPPSTGSGQQIGIIEFGGGYQLSDLQLFWKDLQISPDPDVVPITVSGPGNSPSNPPSLDDLEVTADITISTAVAPQAQARVYFANNDVGSAAQAIAQAAQDGVCVISISWGDSESKWDSGDMQTGFPLNVAAFEGNRAETATMVPVINDFKTAHNLPT
jgi:kumamolisin